MTDIESSDLIEVGGYPLLAEAHLAQHALTANGIESIIDDTVNPEYRGATVSVRAADAERARAILDPLKKTLREIPPHERRFVCPECAGTLCEVTWTPPSTAWEAMKTLFTSHDIRRAEVRCLSCTHAWSVPW